MCVTAWSDETRLCRLPMRNPPVRSYIQRAPPRARARRRLMTPSLVSTGIRKGRTRTRWGAWGRINPRAPAGGGALPTPRFTTTDDVVLPGRRWVRTDAPRAAVVLVHGFTASANAPAVCDVAEALHADGVDVVCYDARGHGTSEGHSTLGDLERHDVAAAVEAARERNDRVVLGRASMGAIAAFRYAAHADGLAGVVSVSCPAEWRPPPHPPGVPPARPPPPPGGRGLAPPRDGR